jgi:predicted KAP-like P-loop ATPase
MDFDWTEAYEERVNGALPDIYIPGDKLDRSKYAKFLTDFLSSRKNESYVMNLNAEWGAGKTYFLQRWFHEIKEAHPATYIDAWKNDFSEDPLLTVISAITETLESNCNVSAETYKKATLKKGARLMKQLAPALFKGVLKTYTGVDADKVADEDDFNLDNFNDAAVKALEIGLLEHQEKIESLQMFKITISNWLKEVISSDSEGELKKPMFVFIDELDRCRPTYAIELLETVKHLFDIPGLIFVIATDTDQLQHSIKAVYGEGFDASRYLYRFFNRSFTLKKPKLREFIATLPVFNNVLNKNLLETLDGILIVKDENQLAENFANIAESFDFDLRTCSQWLDQISAALSSDLNCMKYSWIIITILIAVKLKDADIFNEYFQKKSPLLKIVDKHKIQNQLLTMENKNVIFKVKPKFIKYWPNVDFRREFSEKDNVRDKCMNTHTILSSLLTLNFSTFTEDKLTPLLKTFSRGSSNDELQAFEMMMYYCQVEKNATREGYIDLVEMASDLA